MDNRRVKILTIPYDNMINMLHTSVSQLPKRVVLPVLTGLPEGTQVLNVFPSHTSRSFDVLLFHRDFPIVPGGQVPEKIELANWELYELDVKKVELEILKGLL